MIMAQIHVMYNVANLFTVSLLKHLAEHACLGVTAQETKRKVLWKDLRTLKHLPEDLRSDRIERHDIDQATPIPSEPE